MEAVKDAEAAAEVEATEGPLAILVHYHEVGLKGGNRGFFEAILARNLEAVLATAGVRRVLRLPGRLIAEFADGASWEAAREAVARVFGVANFARAYRSPLDIERMKEAIASGAAGRRFGSFAVRAKRGVKTFPLNSQQVNEAVGAAVQARTGARVDLDSPELLIRIEILAREALFFFDRSAGAGGLPTGASGKAVSLLSGGIDSPVASYQVMKRGCRLIFVHFHSHPYTDRASQAKVVEIVRLLTRHQLRSRLYAVPFAEIQQKLVVGAPAPLRVVLYRRFMFRIAEAIARREGALALVTGESLGQVASQTLGNLATINSVARLPVLRPLIGTDKQEIVEIARRIGTFETSIEPHQDCCTFLMPRKPATSSKPEDLDRAEAGLDIAEMVRSAVVAAERRDFTIDGDRR